MPLRAHRRLSRHQYPQHHFAHWRGWLKPKIVAWSRKQLRGITRRANPETKRRTSFGFPLNDDRPLFAFGGDSGTNSRVIAVQNPNRSPGPHLATGFLTTAPNAIVEPIHPKAMPGDPDNARGMPPSGCARPWMKRNRCRGVVGMLT